MQFYALLYYYFHQPYMKLVRLNYFALFITLIVYQLKNDETFKHASFFALFKHPTETLGEDLQGQERVSFKPGDKYGVSLELKSEVKFLGVIAAYTNIDEAQWRIVIPLERTWGTESQWVDVKRLELSVQGGGKKASSSQSKSFDLKSTQFSVPKDFLGT